MSTIESLTVVFDARTGYIGVRQGKLASSRFRITRGGRFRQLRRSVGLGLDGRVGDVLRARRRLVHEQGFGSFLLASTAGMATTGHTPRESSR